LIFIAKQYIVQRLNVPKREKEFTPVRTSRTISVEKIMFFAVVLLAIYLALKSLKQFIYLSFTLLSLKVVWILLIVLAFLTSIKKRP